MSVLAEVDYENVAIGYQTIRYVCGYAYEMKEKLEKKQEDKSDIFNRQTDKIIKAISDPQAECLFY